MNMAPPPTPPGVPEERGWPVKECPRCERPATSDDDVNYTCTRLHDFLGKDGKDYLSRS